MSSSSTSDTMYWFEEDDFDEFHDFYLLVRRERLKGMELETYAAIGKSFVNMINWMIQRGMVTYRREKRVYSAEDYIYARVSVDHEIFCMRFGEYLEKYGSNYPEYLV